MTRLPQFVQLGLCLEETPSKERLGPVYGQNHCSTRARSFFYRLKLEITCPLLRPVLHALLLDLEEHIAAEQSQSPTEDNAWFRPLCQEVWCSKREPRNARRKYRVPSFCRRSEGRLWEAETEFHHH